MISFIFNFIKGVVYGTFSVIPGLSGGVVANYFGDYKRSIGIISRFDISFKNIFYLVNILLGIILGTIISSKYILFFYKTYNKLFMFIIIVINVFLIVNYYLNKKPNIVPIIITLLIFLFCRNFISIVFSQIIFLFPFVRYIMCSVLYSFSKILPGISSTSILVNLDFYDDIMLFFSNPYRRFLSAPLLWTIFWVIFLVISFFLLKLIDHVIDKRYFDYFLVSVTIFNLVLLVINY